MSVRMAVVAGRFYESNPNACRDHVKQMLAQARVEGELPERIIAGVVPHAGWTFSGAVAGMVFKSMQNQRVDTFVIFGAVHAVRGREALLYDTGGWGSPLGTIEVDEQLAEAILAEGSELIKADCKSHSQEHSIEVQIPFIQYLFEEAKIVPIMAPPSGQSHQIGEAVARVIEKSGKQVVCIGSTDLTHYGPSYLFTPMGTGEEGVRWAKEQNDKFFLDLALSMQADKLVESANSYGSACGAGAVAATAAAARQLGAKKGYLLAHTTSAEVMAERYGQGSTDSVGYAAIVFG